MINQKPEYKTLFFDLDDTLVDFKASEALALEFTYGRFYSAAVEKEIFIRNFHIINQELWRSAESMCLPVGGIGLKRFEILSNKLSIDVDASQVAAFYEDKLGSTISWLPETQAAISILNHYYKLGIITNGFTKVQNAKYQHLSLGNWFKSFVVSEEVGIPKPHQTIFEIALKEVNEVPMNVLMIGDSLTSDFQGSLNAKIDFCWINANRQELPSHLPKPKFILQSVAELPQILGVKVDSSKVA